MVEPYYMWSCNSTPLTRITPITNTDTNKITGHRFNFVSLINMSPFFEGFSAGFPRARLLCRQGSENLNASLLHRQPLEL